MSFLKFAAVGVVGFIVDAFFLLLFSSFVSLNMARVGAFWLAATTTWLGNRCFTFRSKSTQKKEEWGKFMLAACVSFVPNWGSFWLLTTYISSSDQHVIIFMLPGILLGMITNFLFSRFWVFKKETGITCA